MSQPKSKSKYMPLTTDELSTIFKSIKSNPDFEFGDFQHEFLKPCRYLEDQVMIKLTYRSINYVVYDVMSIALWDFFSFTKPDVNFGALEGKHSKVIDSFESCCSEFATDASEIAKYLHVLEYPTDYILSVELTEKMIETHWCQDTDNIKIVNEFFQKHPEHYVEWLEIFRVDDDSAFVNPEAELSEDESTTKKKQRVE
jgi:hypothetical protein